MTSFLEPFERLHALIFLFGEVPSVIFRNSLLSCLRRGSDFLLFKTPKNEASVFSEMRRLFPIMVATKYSFSVSISSFTCLIVLGVMLVGGPVGGAVG